MPDVYAVEKGGKPVTTEEGFKFRWTLNGDAICVSRNGYERGYMPPRFTGGHNSGTFKDMVLEVSGIETIKLPYQLCITRIARDWANVEIKSA